MPPTVSLLKRLARRHSALLRSLRRVDLQELDEEPEERRPELGCDLDRRARRRVAGCMRLHEIGAVAEDER